MFRSQDTHYPALQARQLEPKQARLAMAVGDNRHTRLGEILLRHWEQTAKACGFPKDDLHRMLEDLPRRAAALDELWLRAAAAGVPASCLSPRRKEFDGP